MTFPFQLEFEGETESEARIQGSSRKQEVECKVLVKFNFAFREVSGRYCFVRCVLRPI